MAAKMTFEEAWRKLEVIAAGRFYRILFELTKHSKGSGGELCPHVELYIDGYKKIFSGVTYEQAFESLEAFLAPPCLEEEVLQMAPKGEVLLVAPIYEKSALALFLESEED